MPRNVARESKGWNVYPRDGGYVVQYRERKGKWRETRVPREHGSSLSRAEQYAASFYADYTNAKAGIAETVTAPEGTGATIRSVHEPWLRMKERDPDVEAGTLGGYRTALSRHILPLIGDVPSGELGPQRLRNFLRDLKTGRTRGDGRKGRVSNQLVRNVAYVLTRFFDDALAEEWIKLDANPMRHPAVEREIPPPQSVAERDGVLKRGEKVHVSIEQAEKLIACDAVPEWRRLLYLVTMTSGGFRPGEMYGLLWSDVHLDEVIPRVSIRKAYKLKARTKGGTKIGKPKTPDAVRDNPLHPLAARALRAWKADGWVKHVGRAPTGSDPVFPSPQGTHWRPRDAGNLRDDLKAAKLPTDFKGIPLNFKDATRHTFMTWLANEGVEDAIITRLVGHGAKSVARKFYVSDDLRPLLAALKKIRLDLSTGKVVELPLVLVAGGGVEGGGQTDARTAVLTADCGKGAASGARNALSSNGNPQDEAASRIGPVDARFVDGDELGVVLVRGKRHHPSISAGSGIPGSRFGIHVTRCVARCVARCVGG